MLRRTLVTLQPGKTQGFRSINLHGQGHRFIAWGHTAAARTDIDLDIDIQGNIRIRGGLLQPQHLLGIVHQHTDARLLGQARQSTGFGQRGDLIGHQYILDASVDKYRSLTDFLTTNAHRPQGHLPKGNLGAFVAFCMGSQTHTAAAQCIEHALQVALKGIQIQHQSGGFNVREGIPHDSGGPRAHSPNPFINGKSINWAPVAENIAQTLIKHQSALANFKASCGLAGVTQWGQAWVNASVDL